MNTVHMASATIDYAFLGERNIRCSGPIGDTVRLPPSVTFSHWTTVWSTTVTHIEPWYYIRVENGDSD